MATKPDPIKAKNARRVIEVFEFLDRNGGKATVTDIARSFGRPQSSTSELLASLVDMGLLYRDPHTRAFFTTPRLAALGTSAQPPLIRDGRLFDLMDRLARSSGCGIALFGMVGMRVQIFRWSDDGQDWARTIGCGSSELLSSSTAGLLMLSTYGPVQANRILWRLNAEAPAELKFNHGEIRERIEQYRRQRHAIGEAGFANDCRVVTTLLPCELNAPPLALGAVFPATMPVDEDRLLRKLSERACDRAGRDDLGDHSELVRMRLRA